MMSVHFRCKSVCEQLYDMETRGARINKKLTHLCEPVGGSWVPHMILSRNQSSFGFSPLQFYFIFSTLFTRCFTKARILFETVSRFAKNNTKWPKNNKQSKQYIRQRVQRDFIHTDSLLFNWKSLYPWAHKSLRNVKQLALAQCILPVKFTPIVFSTHSIDSKKSIPIQKFHS